ncbi:MAG: hypothetical protein M3Z09_06660 [Acidobacteriota bacterium]|nr:hypothetical protein [Acidobacteriota bacterium]
MKAFVISCFSFALAAQDNAPASPGWRRFGEGSPISNAPAGAYQAQAPLRAPGPAEFTIPPGTWITARVEQPISSDHNQPGDSFMATLEQPIVVNGLVVARRGQSVSGRVADVLKAGRVKGTSRLGLELTELGLADGQQVPVKTQLIERRGETSVGRDVGALGVTTGLGAAIGAAAGGGLGAAIGAAAGAAVGTTGVLVTRGRETVVFPEQVLTFRLETPVQIVSQAVNAFQPAQPSEYDRPLRTAQGPVGRPGYGAYPAYPAYPLIGGYGYPYPYFGSFGGYFYSGPRFYYGRGRYRR